LRRALDKKCLRVLVSSGALSRCDKVLYTFSRVEYKQVFFPLCTYTALRSNQWSNALFGKKSRSHLLYGISVSQSFIMIRCQLCALNLYSNVRKKKKSSCDSERYEKNKSKRLFLGPKWSYDLPFYFRCAWVKSLWVLSRLIWFWKYFDIKSYF
jgi:hypothetical protein